MNASTQTWLKDLRDIQIRLRQLSFLTRKISTDAIYDSVNDEIFHARDHLQAAWRAVKEEMEE